MKIMKLAEKIGQLGKTTEEKQKYITMGEGYSLWTTLVSRYDCAITTKTLLNFVKDEDLRFIVKKGLRVLESQVEVLEDLCREFGVPMPSRPPQDCTVVVDNNILTDEFIFREIYNGMSNMMFKHLSNYQRAHNSSFRETFKKNLDEELDLYDNFYEYGRLKTYLMEPPSLWT